MTSYMLLTQRICSAWPAPVAMAALAMAALAVAMAPAHAAGAADGMATPLTTVPGDPLNGRAIVTNRQLGLCLLCHSGPFPEVGQQGNLAPDLAGAGSRLNEAQLRLRIVDSRRVQPQSLMPAYFRTQGLHRVGLAWQGQPLLQAQQIEDVVAFLVSLK